MKSKKQMIKVAINAFTVALITLQAVSAHASPGLIPGNSYHLPDGSNMTITETKLCKRGTPVASDVDTIELADMNCQTKKAFQGGLEAIGLTLGICAAAPSPGQVIFGVSALAVGVAVFTLDKIPCADEDVRKQVENICVVLRQQGYKCDPNKVDLRKIQ